MRKTLRAIGWIAAGLAGLCVVLYLAALAINWRDQEPNAAAVRLAAMFRERPAVADEDNGHVYLQRSEFDRSARTRIARVQELIGACQPGDEACARAFDAADGLYNEWHAAQDSLLDTYLALVAHTGWREEISVITAESLPPYSGAMDGQRLLLLRARELAKRGDVAAASALLERDLQFWRKVLESSDILISKMIAAGALNRHFEWGHRVLRQVPARDLDAAIPQGWRRGISDTERSMVRCMAGEWIFASLTLNAIADGSLSEAGVTTVGRISLTLARPMFQPQATANIHAEHYWQLAQTFAVPFDRYEEALRRADEVTAQNTAAARPRIYNLPGVLLGFVSLNSYSDYAARVADIEGVRRAALLATTLRAAGIEAEDMAEAVANAELLDPYTDRPFDWDAARRAIVFRGLATGERREHRIYY